MNDQDRLITHRWPIRKLSKLIAIRPETRSAFTLARRLILSVLVLLTFLFSTDVPQPPEAEISNGIIHAKLLLPDAGNGHYRGVRFDWSGVVADLTFNGHHYFGKWSDQYSPTLHDAIMGPVDAFDPIGYEGAKPGEIFYKIGVGAVEKIDAEPYAFVKPYRLVNGGAWKTRPQGKNAMRYEHVLNDPKCSYRYTKTLALTRGKPELVISYSLKNTGTNRIETNVFNHNFFVMDEQPTGPDFSVTFPFVPVGEPKGKATAALLDGKVIRYQEILNKGESFYVSPLTGFGSTASDYDLLVSNAKTKTAVHVVGDKPIVKFVYWSAARTLCPEPFIHIAVDPGEEMEWKLTYTFLADTSQK